MSAPLSLIIENIVPPGGWRYLEKQTGVWINAACPSELKAAARQHRKANALPIPADFDQQIEDQICQFIPPEFCSRRNGRTPVIPSSLTLIQALQGTATLGDWLLHGRVTVDIDTATERARCCAHCHFNQQIDGCSTCSLDQLRKMVAAVIGSKRTPFDDKLQICAVCGCATKAKIWIPLDIVHRHLTADQQSKLPDFCWAKKTT